MIHRKPLPANVEYVGKVKTRTGTIRPRYRVTCLFCGKDREITRHDHAERLSRHRCKSCSSKNNHPQGEHRGVRISWFSKFPSQAANRSLEFTVTIDDIVDILDQQGWKCALSGIPLVASGDFNQITASLDRIDNAMGYSRWNVQVVHKKVNMMRGQLSVDEFVEFCKAVAQNQNEMVTI